MLMAEERGLRGEYQTEDLYLSVIQSLKKHPQQVSMPIPLSLQRLLLLLHAAHVAFSSQFLC